MLDKVHIGVASIPSRVAALYNVVKALLPQCDHMYVYLNGYENIPEFLEDDKIEVYMSEYTGDLSDNGKFYKAKDVQGYFLTVDDDILYPSDYVKKLVDKIEEHDRKAVVGLHGTVFASEIFSYYRSRIVSHCLHEVKHDKRVQLLGTGVMGYHTSLITFDYATFEHKHMSDIMIAIRCQAAKIPMICIAHSKDYVRDGGKAYYKGSIHEAQVKKDHVQTKIVRAINWKTY